MNFCPNCGSKQIPNSKFCINCGNNLKLTDASNSIKSHSLDDENQFIIKKENNFGKFKNFIKYSFLLSGFLSLISIVVILYFHLSEFNFTIVESWINSGGESSLPSEKELNLYNYATYGSSILPLLIFLLVEVNYLLILIKKLKNFSFIEIIKIVLYPIIIIYVFQASFLTIVDSQDVHLVLNNFPFLMSMVLFLDTFFNYFFYIKKLKIQNNTNNLNNHLQSEVESFIRTKDPANIR